MKGKNLLIMTIKTGFLAVIILVLTSMTQANPTVTISVSSSGWGEARTEDIKAVLQSVASELTSEVSSIDEISIIVKPSGEGIPRTLYKRGPNGEFIILLSAKDRYWAKYSYQFAHELSHTLSMNQSDRQTPNQWFEEAIGETASLFALRSMGRSWKTNPPYSNWKSYSSSLTVYADNNINEEHRQIPSNQTFVEWFEENENSLRANPYLREKDELIANQLLELFEDDPTGWDAVSFLNQTKPTSNQTFGIYLGNWYRDAPQRNRPFIRKVAKLFGYKFN